MATTFSIAKNAEYLGISERSFALRCQRMIPSIIEKRSSTQAETVPLFRIMDIAEVEAEALGLNALSTKDLRRLRSLLERNF